MPCGSRVNTKGRELDLTYSMTPVPKVRRNIADTS
jgi:hypothetical protein